MNKARFDDLNKVVANKKSNYTVARIFGIILPKFQILVVKFNYIQRMNRNYDTNLKVKSSFVALPRL